jgi:hypothetical protein
VDAGSKSLPVLKPLCAIGKGENKLANIGLASIKFTKNLKGMTAKSANSATGNGLFTTDTIASWIKRGFVNFV